jgi:DNA-binding NarL/FixJ family response regulator
MTSPNTSATTDSGVIVLDRSLTLLAADRGAAVILNDTTVPENGCSAHPRLPQHLLAIISNSTVTTQVPVTRYVRIGQLDYLCRTYYLHSHSHSHSHNTNGCEPALVIHLARTVAATVTIDEVSSIYHLTEREKQILSGLSSMGLTNKELAERLNISCNTVKFFVRLLMIKMRVTTRAGIVAKLLDRGPAYTEFVALKHVI